MVIKRFIQKKIYKYRYNNESFISYLRKKGIQIGNSVKFFSPRTTNIDVTRPYLLIIGNNVKIAANVTILTHDYSYSVLRIKYHDLLNECSGKTIIGNNVFIGIGSIILPGVQIGNNCIIGAGSVVTKDIPEDSVAAGNPAKIICSLEEFYKKRKNNQVDEAFKLAKYIRETYNREPTIKEMGSFFPLFLPRNEKLLEVYDIFTNLSGDNQNEVIQDWLSSDPIFDNFEDFLQKSKQ